MGHWERRLAGQSADRLSWCSAAQRSAAEPVSLGRHSAATSTIARPREQRLQHPKPAFHQDVTLWPGVLVRASRLCGRHGCTRALSCARRMLRGCGVTWRTGQVANHFNSPDRRRRPIPLNIHSVACAPASLRTVAGVKGCLSAPVSAVQYGQTRYKYLPSAGLTVRTQRHCVPSSGSPALLSHALPCPTIYCMCIRWTRSTQPAAQSGCESPESDRGLLAAPDRAVCKTPMSQTATSCNLSHTPSEAMAGNRKGPPLSGWQPYNLAYSMHFPITVF